VVEYDSVGSFGAVTTPCTPLDEASKNNDHGKKDREDLISANTKAISFLVRRVQYRCTLRDFQKHRERHASKILLLNL